jgi:hypothetical protein
MSAAEIGLKLGVSKHAVIGKARRLGLSSPSINRKVKVQHTAPLWPATRTARLRKLWGRMSAAEIGLKLGVSKHAVIGKARRLGLSSPSISRKVKVRHTAPSRALPGVRGVAPSRGQSVD